MNQTFLLKQYPDLQKVIDKLSKNYNPYSIFLYGSKATISSNINSDYEIGIIFEDDKYISRQEIAKLINNKNYSIFPFRLSEVKSYNIDTPFEKNIYMNVLISGGSKTLYGQHILEDLEPPIITKENLLADINFNLGIALAAVRVYKSGNIILANDMFYKSCLYVTRDFIYFHTNKLCLSYKEIYENFKQLEILKDYKEILDTAYYLRVNPNETIEPKIYYKNISYINQFILKQLCNK